MKVIGIIGGCGSGKSEVANLFKHKFNAYVINADKIGHEVIKKGMDTYTKIIDHFGKGILDDHGNINRKKLGEIVFTDAKQLKVLTSITHPAINKEIYSIITEINKKGDVDYIVLEITAPGEGDIYPLIDEYWYVYCDLEVRFERLAKYRNMTRKSAKDIMSKQLTDEQFRQYAHVVLNNSHTLNDTYKQMLGLIDKANKA